jgi:hypothetical protein
MFGRPKREADLRMSWCVPSILFTRAIERKEVILSFFQGSYEGVRLQDAFTTFAFLPGTRHLLPLVNGVRYYSRVAERLLYKGYDKSTSIRL